MTQRPPRSTRTDTLCPYASLFRSIDAVRRRAKYLLLDTAAGSALLHLGMSGSLRVLPADAPVRVHDHFDIALAGLSRGGGRRSEEHTSELQSLMRISYAVFCLKKKT